MRIEIEERVKWLTMIAVSGMTVFDEGIHAKNISQRNKAVGQSGEMNDDRDDM